MILEYKTNSHTWNMVDGDISTCYYGVEDEVKKIKKENPKEKWDLEIRKFFKSKVLEAGFATDFPNRPIVICSDKDWAEIEAIEIVVVSRKNNHETFVFDYDYRFRLLYNDGTIIREYGM